MVSSDGDGAFYRVSLFAGCDIRQNIIYRVSEILHSTNFGALGKERVYDNDICNISINACRHAYTFYTYGLPKLDLRT
jgi:hypothetical protein